MVNSKKIKGDGEMKIAVIGDVHSNIYALETVLNDINRHNVDFIVSTGDLVGYVPFPNEVIDCLRAEHIISVQGNYDKAIGNKELICGCDYKDPKMIELASLSVQYTNKTIREDNRHFLKYLPKEIRINAGVMNILVVHGSPRRMNEFLYENSVELSEVTLDLMEDILICGHTHIPYYRIINGKHVINSGSVGKPKHGNTNAVYVIVEVIGSDVKVDFIEVEYDVERTAVAIEANEILPNEFAEMLRKG